jgi:hypothetical protein
MIIESYERQFLELSGLEAELKKKKAALDTELREVMQKIGDANRRLAETGEFSDREWYAGLQRSRKILTAALYALTAESTEIRAKRFAVTTEYNIERAKLKQSDYAAAKNRPDISLAEREALQLSPEEYAEFKEKVRTYKTELRKNLIAARTGGNGSSAPPKPVGRKYSEETKLRMRQAQRERRERERLRS